MLIEWIAGIAAGACAPFQTAVNARLRTAARSAFVSSLVNFAVGTIFLILVGAIGGFGFLPSPARIGRLPWWGWLPGFLGSLFVCGNIMLFPLLGGVQTATIPLVGQIVTSVVIDAAGWFGSARIAASPSRICGALLVVAGILVSAIRPKARPSSRTRSGSVSPLGRLLAQLSALGIGVCFAIQSAINGANGKILGSAIHSALVNFIVGTLVFALLTTAGRQWSGIRTAIRAEAPAWSLLGGAFGGINLALIALLAPRIGTGMTLILGLIGQIVASLLVDGFGLFGAQKRHLLWQQFAGLAIMVAGALLVDLV